jgi:hypothetical protein
LEHQQTVSGTTSQSNVNLNQVIDYADNEKNILRNAMIEMNRKIDELIADTHQDAIKFNGFGFRRYDEAAAWLVSHSLDQKIGLIMDIHIVFEHLYSAAKKTVPALQQLKKVSLSLHSTNQSQNCSVMVRVTQ